MECTLLINLIGISLNLIGAIILSISFSKYFKAVDNSFHAMETSLDSIADTLNNPNQPGVIFQGMDQHRDRGRKFSKTFTLIGLILIIAGDPYTSNWNAQTIRNNVKDKENK